MARSPLNEAVRKRQHDAEARLPFDVRSARAIEGARRAVRDYAATHGLTWQQARRRLQENNEKGRNRGGDE